jgi:hypothetical protein
VHSGAKFSGVAASDDLASRNDIFEAKRMVPRRNHSFSKSGRIAGFTAHRLRKRKLSIVGDSKLVARG